MTLRRRTLIAVTALVAWVAGSALGSLGAVAPASAQAGIVIGKAHAGFAPSLSGSEPIVLSAGPFLSPGQKVKPRRQAAN